MLNPVKEFMTGVALKAAGVNDLPFPTQPSGLFRFLPNQKILNFRKIGDGLTNSAVSAVIRSMGRAYGEPTMREYERVDGQDRIVEDSEVTALIANPNPHMEPEMVWLYAVAAISTTGAGYLHKVRNLMGDIIQLWPLYPEFVTPVTPQDGSEFLSGWKYTPPGGQQHDVPAEDMIQLRWEMARHDFRLGHAPLQDVLLEVLQDHEAAEFSTALLTNLGVPGVVLSPKDPDDRISDPKQVAADFQSKFTGTKRGEPFVGGAALNVETVSFSPKDMDLTALRRVPEERISAVLGWPAILAGLGAGLTATSGRGESSTLREDAIESTLIPLWKLAGRQLTRQLLHDEKSFGPPKLNHSLQMDLTQVRALKKDEKDEVDKIDTAVTGGWATVGEARTLIGLPVQPSHDVFLRNISTFPVGEAEDPTVIADGEPSS
jgi:HK97 family phage portal protein